MHQLQVAGDRGIHRIVGTFVGAADPDIDPECQVEQGDWTDMSGPMRIREWHSTLEHTRGPGNGKAGVDLIDGVHDRPIMSIHSSIPAYAFGTRQRPSPSNADGLAGQEPPLGL